MTGVIATLPKFQFSANGVPMVSGTLTVYLAGTTTPTDTWQDSALSTLNTNPIVLDARGECVLWLDSTKSYKFVLKNAGGVTQWTQDNISGAASVASLTGIFTKVADLAASSGASLVGYLPAGTGAVATTVQAKLRESVSVSDFGSGYAALVLALASIGSSEVELIVNTPITVTANLTVPRNITFKVDRGTAITINTGVTLTILGEIAAGNYTVFYGAGTLDVNAGEAFLNLVWFDGAYLNDRWNFILRGLVSLRPFTVFVPKPEIGMQGAVEVATNLIYWGIDAPIEFPDKANGCTWIQYHDTRIIATTVMDSMMLFSPDSKVEDVQFPFGIWLIGDAKAYYGMKLLASARVDFGGEVLITDCAVCFYGGSSIPGGLTTYIERLYTARWTVAAVILEGESDGVVSTQLKTVHCEVPAADNTNCIILKGTMRGVRIGDILYRHTADAKRVTNIVLIQSTATGFSVDTKIESIYSDALVTTAVKIENSGGATRAYLTEVGKIQCSEDTISADLNYDIYTNIRNPYTTVKYGANCLEPRAVSNSITRVYDFAEVGGAAQTYDFGGSLPVGARILRAWYVVNTALTSAGTPTVRLGITGTLAGIQAALLFNNAAYSLGIHDGLPNGTAANALPIVANSTTYLSLVIANATLTGGKITIHAEYVL